MKIQNKIKISFIIIVVLVFIVGCISVLITFNIKHNSYLNSQISQIILFQERMNQAIEKVGDSNSMRDIDSLKEKFDSYEKSFEKIKTTISQKNPFFFYNEDKDINRYLQKLYKNEHIIELSFKKMYDLQEDFVKAKQSFQKMYPLENFFHASIYKTLLKLNNQKAIINFSQVRYYSKETLYQKPSDYTLGKWLSYIELTKKDINDPILVNSLNKYKKVAEQIGQNTIKLKSIKLKKIKLKKNINKILNENKKLANLISKKIAYNSENIMNIMYTFMLGIFLVIILFIVIFSYVVSKNVGLSVEQIEQKVKEGLKEISQLNKEIEDTQKEVIFTMGTIAEYRSKETGNHVKRVAHYSRILAVHYGLSKNEVNLLQQASPMHDIGKIAIPDAILNKPGKFDEKEREIMNTHAYLGYKMLKNSNRPLLKAAAIVAYEHHEKWDGTGYPRGLSGENIHIYGRITAVADVFDALGSDRVYKKAWDNERIFKLFKEERGKHFDPKLIDIFFNNLNEFLKIQDKFRDI